VVDVAKEKKKAITTVVTFFLRGVAEKKKMLFSPSSLPSYVVVLQQ
jgi:hypothetical protein